MIRHKKSDTLVSASMSAPLLVRSTAAFALLYFAAIWRGVKPFYVEKRKDEYSKIRMCFWSDERKINNIQHNTTQHNTTQHNTTQHNTTQHDTTRHNTTQHNTTQHNTTQHDTTQHINTWYNNSTHTHRSSDINCMSFLDKKFDWLREIFSRSIV
jgi:hypothetical protein